MVVSLPESHLSLRGDDISGVEDAPSGPVVFGYGLFHVIATWSVSGNRVHRPKGHNLLAPSSTGSLNFVRVPSGGDASLRLASRDFFLFASNILHHPGGFSYSS